MARTILWEITMLKTFGRLAAIVFVVALNISVASAQPVNAPYWEIRDTVPTLVIECKISCLDHIDVVLPVPPALFFAEGLIHVKPIQIVLERLDINDTRLKLGFGTSISAWFMTEPANGATQGKLLEEYDSATLLALQVALNLEATFRRVPHLMEFVVENRKEWAADQDCRIGEVEPIKIVCTVPRDFPPQNVAAAIATWTQEMLERRAIRVIRPQG